MTKKKKQFKRDEIIRFLTAAKDGDLETFRSFLSQDIDVNVVLNEATSNIPAGNTALMLAAAHAQLAIVYELLPEIEYKNQFTRENIIQVSAKRHNVDLMLRNPDNYDAFECALRAKIPYKAFAEKIDKIAIRILDATPDQGNIIKMQAKYATHSPALLYATEKGLIDTATRLAKYGVNYNIAHVPLESAPMNEDGVCTPLRAAIVGNHIDLALMYIDGEIMMEESHREVRARNGVKPYAYVMKIGIESNENSEVNNNALKVGVGDLYLAARYAEFDLIEQIAIRMSDVEFNKINLHFLLENILERCTAFNCNFQDYKISNQDNGEIAQNVIDNLILPRVPNFLLKIDEYNNNRSLMFAAVGGDARFIHYLVEKGLSVTLKDSNGLTPIAYAAKTRQIGVIPALLHYGAEFNDIALTDLEYNEYPFFVINPITQLPVNCVGSLFAFAALHNNESLLEKIFKKYPMAAQSIYKPMNDSGQSFLSFMYENEAIENGYAETLEFLDNLGVSITRPSTASSMTAQSAVMVKETSFLLSNPVLPEVQEEIETKPAPAYQPFCPCFQSSKPIKVNAASHISGSISPPSLERRQKSSDSIFPSYLSWRSKSSSGSSGSPISLSGSPMKSKRSIQIVQKTSTLSLD